MQIRIEYRLLPGGSARLRHNRGDNIHQLCQTGHLHPVRMSEECDQHAADQERIFEIVMILQLGRSYAPRLNLGIGFIRMVPDVPFVEAEIHRLLTAFLCFDIIAGGRYGADKMLQVHAARQEILGIVVAVPVILMQGDVIGNVIGMFKCYRFPFREGRHCRAGTSAGDKFDVRINQTHRLACLVGQSAVFSGCLLSDLPGSVHFIAETPGLDLVGLRYPVLPP
ncbi:hypothetical protein D3C73_1093750 [compost metagenome]